MKNTKDQFSEIVDAWIEAAIFAEVVWDWSDGDGDEEPTPIDRHAKELSVKAVSKLHRYAKKHVKEFLADVNENDVLSFVEQYGWDYFGHNMYLNCSGHGVGFFDYGELGHNLAEHSKKHSIEGVFYFWTSSRFPRIQIG